MSIFQFLQTHQTIFFVIVIATSLCVGSFLNVVIYRYPLMLENSWRQQCLSYLGQANEINNNKLNLITPASHCPHCKQKIVAWFNIPILSYLLLRGKCIFCKEKISLFYPAIEIITPLLSSLVVIKFGLSWQSVWGVVLTWNLIALSVIDLKKHILPDAITLPVLWLGLLLSLFHIYTTPRFAIFGVLFGYSFLWIIAKLFKLLRKKEGMGHGDFKLFAMLGAWLGLPALVNILFFAAVLGIIIGVLMIGIKKSQVNEPIPFGPYLAIAAWLHLIKIPIACCGIFLFS